MRSRATTFGPMAQEQIQQLEGLRPQMARLAPAQELARPAVEHEIAKLTRIDFTRREARDSSKFCDDGSRRPTELQHRLARG